MSTIYSDALNNKFLGNCKYGNHDINYPSINWLSPHALSSDYTPMLSSMETIINDVSLGYNSVSFNSAAFLNGGDVFSLRFVDASNPLMKWTIQTSGWSAGSVWNASSLSHSMYKHGATSYYTTCCFGSQSISMHLYLNWAPYNGAINYHRKFAYMGKLLDVNPNFNYYTPNINHYVAFIIRDGYLGTSLTTLDQAQHYIVSAAKALLQTGDAIYPVACQGGSPTPTGQWATDMYVFDNNATLGYPCIGKVQNMLLGVGTYTYLKPVELITAPDAGSNLWLPVGTYAGRTLLMRCYSE